MVHHALSVQYIETATEEEALLLEEQLIKQHKPDYNRLLKHNSNYVYIRRSKEDFPKVQIVRKRRDDKATYV
jgi:excinuclease ABC subunit C